MKNKFLYIGLFMISLLCAILIGINFAQKDNNDRLVDQINVLKNNENNKEQKIAQLTNEKDNSQKQLALIKTSQNNQNKDQSDTSFNDVTNKYLSAMFNFDQDSYGKRKYAVKQYISNDLYNKYFPQNRNLGDSNNVTSKLDNVDLYTKTKQGSNMQGLAVVTFESKSGDNDFKKSTNVYQLTFDTSTNKITNMQDLGSSLKMSDVN